MAGLRDPFGAPPPPAQRLAASREMLQGAQAALEDRDQRSLLARLKAAAGYAVEAWLTENPRSWGASPVTRLACFARDEGVPEEVRAAASVLLTARMGDPGLVQLGSSTGPGAWLRAAEALVAHCEAIIDASQEDTRPPSIHPSTPSPRG